MWVQTLPVRYPRPPTFHVLQRYWRAAGQASAQGGQLSCLPELLGLLDALIPGIDFSLVSLHEVVALQDGNQPLHLTIPLHQTTATLSNPVQTC